MTSLLFLVLRHTNLFVGRCNKKRKAVDLLTSCGAKKIIGTIFGVIVQSDNTYSHGYIEDTICTYCSHTM